MKGGIAMKNDLISVIMSVYNEKDEWIKQSVESIINQSYRNLQIIIVLDSPSNNNARKLLLHYQNKDSRVRIIENDKNIGLVASLNKALLYADGKYIARMDADDISEENRIYTEINCLLEKHVDFVMSRINMIDEDGKIFSSNAGKSYNMKSIRKIMRYGNVSAHPTWLLKREIYDKLGGYRELKYCEDYDFLMRALQKEYQCYCIGEALLHYRIRKSGISESYATEQYLKAHFIREAYRSNKSIQDIQIEKLNERFKNEELLSYDTALYNIKSLSNKLAEKGNVGIKDMISITKNMLVNSIYRKIFWENMCGHILLQICGEKWK